ncbi:IS630 family transposase [Paracidovorax avenae]|uniref:IS630 family transposase n=1 Tax=Paracidovorax avenae TaxID=80867 RepID=UPI0006B3B2AF|nr:IS630 family transposase [Paracidovorax avenae]
MARPHAVAIELSDADRTALQSWTRRRKTAQALALRARIVLACAEPAATNRAIAKALNVSALTVAKWRRRFAEMGLAGLQDSPRSGAPRSILDEQVEAVITTTLESVPDNATHWSTRSLAAHLGMSQTAISRIWRAFALAPHRTEGFKLSTDPHFVDKVRDIVGLYLHPPERAMVLCVDEKPSIAAHSDTVPAVPMRPGQPERHTHDYIRHGTTDLFAALDVKAGTVIAEVHRRHRSVEFRHFLQTVERATPAHLDLHLVLDNASTHKSPIIQRWLLRHPRVHLHFTPTSASWINLVECWFSILTARQIRRGRFRSTRALENAIRAYVAMNNAAPKPFVWTKTADEILQSVAEFCLRTSDSHH